MLSKVITILVLAAVAHAAALGDDTNIREEKGLNLLPSLLSIITFNNDPCDSASGDTGTCYTSKECATKEGTADGRCANGFGVCCVLSGNININTNNTYFVSPANLNSASRNARQSATTTYTALIVPSANIVQIRLNIEDLTLMGPVEGDCGNDTLVIEGANSGTQIPVLCGTNTNQHVIFDIDNSAGPYKVVATIATDYVFTRSWKIKMMWYTDSDKAKAPPRSLQYYTATSGVISSFNNGGTSPMMLNNQVYSISFGYVAGFCDIDVTFSRLDFGDINGECEDDFVSVGCEKTCGDLIDVTVRANATGSISMTVMSDDMNELSEEGFTASYMMLSC